MVLSGFFYDGLTSRQHVGTLELTPDKVILKQENSRQTWEFPLQEIKLRRKMSGVPREIELPERRLFVSGDHDLIEQWFKANTQLNNTESFLHRLENHKGMIVGAMFVTLFFTWWIFIFGIPLGAKVISHTMPHHWAEKLGEGGLETLDSLVFKPSNLQAETQNRITQKFTELSSELDTVFTFDLHFRDGGVIGANALALPNGDIVVTDQLIALSSNDDEVLSILAHEIGHVDKRHGLQTLVRGAFLTFVVAYATGDLVGVEELLVLLPNLMLESKYSREAEHEADDFAYDLMLKEGIPLSSFADIMERLTAESQSSDEEDNKQTSDFLSSHPATEERIARFRQAH